MKRAVLVFALTLWMTCPVWSATPPLPIEGETPRISMDLKDANIKDVLKIFSQQAGLNFVASQEIEDRTLTLYLDRVTVQDALNNIMSANRLEYVKVPGSDIFIVRPMAEAEGEDLIMKVYRLKFARVSRSPLEAAASNSTYTAALQSFAGRQGSAGSSGSTGSGFSGGYTGSGGGLGGGFPGSGLGGGLGGGLGSGGISPRGIDLVLEDLLSPRGTLVTDPRTNSVIITDVPERFSFFEEAIARLDRPVSQVVIEAEILETTVNALDNLGFKWGSSTGQLATFEGPKKSTHFPLGAYSKGADSSFTVGTISLADTDIILELLKSNTDTKVLSRPRIMTMDNEGASIHITAETAMASLTTATTVEGTALSEVGRAERRTTGISLRVTPQINDDHFITMMLEPSVVRAEKSEFFPTEFVDPQQRSAQTTVMVQDGETVVIGGLVSTDIEDTERKVPVLGDLPLIGLFFRHKDRDQLDRELLVFVTPHVVKTSEIPFMASGVPPSPITVTVPEETREELPPYSKEREIEAVLNRFSTKP